ncbi:MAG: six-cysteine ranthipeptide SCIFF [Eubacteriales bacterium]|nr:six-cysteine ranthipeptide SCIFF [Eubacteriales bacterium]MDD4326973.1 six-cysteine ranthipeptide SCIFF [Eubacteriales bacterium]MDD4717690.1 six-cysteine ranthipeptide SCIFF [Eubacteriales bacterium]NCU25107.1 six-cysteine peptide SCIFF [Candidatus Nomurabacteria bacterium]
MSHIRTISKNKARKPLNNKACGECQTSCQSACKTSCTVANQKCENLSK